MEQTKQKLTDLIATIDKSLPNDTDLKGFPGISKALITDTLIQSDALLVGLKEYDNLFETIIMKRELAELFAQVNKELEKGFDHIKANEFNSILKDITRIRFIIKETYISVAKDQSVKTEAEIIKAKEQLNSLLTDIEGLKKASIDINTLKDSTVANIETVNAEISLQKESATKKITEFQEATIVLNDTAVKSINEIHEQVKVLKTSADTIVADFQEKQRIAIENEKKIGDFLLSVELLKTIVEATQKNTTQWEQDINKSKDEIAANAIQYAASNLKIKSLQDNIEEAHKTILGTIDEDGKPVAGYLQDMEDLMFRINAFLGEQKLRYNTQFDQIEGLLPGATSIGLAEAYRIQKSSYKKPMQLWSTIFISIMSVMTILSAIIIYLQFKETTKQTVDQALIALLKDLPFFIPTIWLASYASKQQSQYKRLQQEYAFKETNAKSFHGHKMQIEALMKDGVTDKDLLSSLVAQLVIITSQNPSVTLDSKSHDDSPPVFKLVETFLAPFTKKKKEGEEEKEKK